MCGPSSAMKQLNSQLTSLSQSMAGEAKKVFGTVDSTVQKILSSVSSIIEGGPSGHGMSQAEINARRAMATEAGGAEARNLRGAAASSVAAIGGGNIALPSGAAGQIATEANIRAAQDTAAAQNQITQEDYQVGRENYWKGIAAAEAAPSAYGVANQFNESAVGATSKAEESQQAIDSMKGWWKPLVMKLGTGLLGAATGGISNAITGGISNLFQGGASAGPALTAGPPSLFGAGTGPSSDISNLFPASNPSIPSFGMPSQGGGIGS